MSKYDKASLVHIPSGYKSGTLYNVLPNDADGDFDFFRGSTATRVNKDGLIETIATGTPRLDYPLLDGVVQDNPTLLLEPQRTNLVTYSEDATQWLLINSTITSNNIISPDGSQNADKFEFTGDGSIRPNVSQLAFTNNYNYSVFIKKGNSSYVTLAASFFTTSTTVGFDLDNEISETGGIIEKYPNEWYRLSLTNNVTGDADRQGAFYIYLPNALGELSSVAGNYAYVWGADIQEASYNTSYIPTSGATVTRSADVCNGAGTAADFNDSEGVLYANIAALANDLTYRELGISNGTTDNRVLISYTNVSNQISGTLRVGAVSQGIMNYTAQSISYYNKVALLYKLNDCSLWVNGFKVAVDTSVNMPSGLSELAFDSGAGSDDFYGKTKEVITFNEALSDTELEALTSYDSFNEMANELLFTIE